jgi:hypothetical protein
MRARSASLAAQPIGAEAKTVALSLLANCGWTHVTQQVLDEFCAANGIEMAELA